MKRIDELQTLINEVNLETNGAYEHVIKEPQDVFWENFDVIDLNPREVANRVYFGNYNPSDEYIGLDGYGNIESMDERTYLKELEDIENELKLELED